jgi:FtsZ-interacting cell division protein YlmF
MATKKKAARKPKKLTRSALVATVTSTSQVADIDVKFFSGIGQITVSLFRNGVLINMQSISTEGVIRLVDVQAGDTMSVNGVCTAKARIECSLPTHPQTPQNYAKGIIMSGFLFL